MNLPVYEPKREDDVFRNVTEHNGGPLTPDALKRIFERIIDEMRSLQRCVGKVRDPRPHGTVLERSRNLRRGTKC